MKMRLSKLMSQRGLCSRREADALIEKGQVLVDGSVCDQLGHKVEEDVQIEILAQRKKKTILLHKPIGYVSCQPEKGYPEAIELVEPLQGRKVGVMGRLDIDSSGLLLLTEDGRLPKRVIGEGARVEKEYLVRVAGKITKDKIKLLQHGLQLDGKPLRRAKIDLLEEGLLRFTLIEGKKRQIRRMCELVELKVTALKRVRIGPIRLGQLKPGEWRTATRKEIEALLR